jgi:hypothetical protein
VEVPILVCSKSVRNALSPDQENSKKQEGKNERKKNKRFFFHFLTYVEVPILVCSPSTRAIALIQPCLRRTHSYGNLPYNLSSFPAFLVILPSNPLSSPSGKKI